MKGSSWSKLPASLSLELEEEATSPGVRWKERDSGIALLASFVVRYSSSSPLLAALLLVEEEAGAETTEEVEEPRRRRRRHRRPGCRRHCRRAIALVESGAARAHFGAIAIAGLRERYCLSAEALGTAPGIEKRGRERERGEKVDGVRSAKIAAVPDPQCSSSFFSLSNSRCCCRG
jgi:hypothetical protein